MLAEITKMDKKANLKKGKENDKKEGNFWLLPGGIVFLTFIVYYGILKGDFLNWDDPSFVLGNSSITSLSWTNFKLFFTSFYVGNYCPLSILSYAIDFSFSGLNPKTFHFTSLAIHLINSVLVYILIYHLTNKATSIAAITSLLFALHPMHIESVAWIAERRDVLYGMFYLASLISYLFYLQKEYSSKYFVYSLLFFVGSLLSKGQAVTLPLAIVLLDFFYNRRLFDKKVILEKIPFFASSLVFGVIAVIAQKSSPAVNVYNLSLFDSLLIGNYGLLLYIIKAFVPFQLSGFHPYPFTHDDKSLSWLMYGAPIMIIGLLVLVYRKFKTDKAILWGALFFLLTIFPVLQFLPVGETILAERYTYIPYLGLFFVIGYLYNHFEKYKLISFTPYLIGFYVAIMIVITWTRIPIWTGSINFWSDVVEKYPTSRTAYNNRGHMHNELKQYDLALADLSKGIECDPTYARLYLNRGVSYTGKGLYELAVDDYTKSIKLDSIEPKTYINRGSLYTDYLSKYDLGIKDFKKYLTLDSANLSAYNNLGVAYYKKGEFSLAIQQFNYLIKKDGTNGQYYYFRSLNYAGKEDYNNAYSDLLKAKQAGFSVDENLLKQWQSKAAEKTIQEPSN